MTARRRNPNRKATPGQAALIIDLNKRLGRNPSPAWYYESMLFSAAHALINELQEDARPLLEAEEEAEIAEEQRKEQAADDCDFQMRFISMLENDQDFKREVQEALGIDND